MRVKNKISAKGIRYAVGATLIVILFFVISIVYSSYVTGLLTTESQMHMSEVAAQGSASVKKQIFRDFDILEVLAEEVISNQDIPFEQKMERIKSQADKFDLFRIGIVDKDGNATTSDGFNFSVADRDFFKSAITGKKFLSEPIIDKIDGVTKGIVYAVPVYNNGEVTNVLFMGYQVDKLVKQIDISFYHKSGLAFIVNSNGDILLHPDETRQDENIFDMAKNNNSDKIIEQFKTNLKNNVNGVTEIHIGEDERFFAYAPIDVENDWFLVTSLQAEAVVERSQKVILLTMLLMIVITVVFALAALYIFLTKIKSNKQIMKLAYSDSLTGAANIEQFKLDSEKLLNKFGPQKYTLLNFDIKQFRYLNKEQGYNVGNEFLIYISNCLADTTVEGEVFARMGADQFLLLFNRKASTEETMTYIDTLRKKITRWEITSERYYPVKLAFGVYNIGEEDIDIMLPIEKSNIARKSIKESYEQDVALYDKTMQSRIDRDKEIENSMPSALKNGEFKLFIQPKYDLLTEKIVGGEALVRWIKQDGTMVMPDDFIPLFEKTGAIYEMDMYMLECVCKFISSQLERGSCVVPISINQSRCYMYNHNYVDTLCKILKNNVVPSNLIEFEITENIVYNDIDKLIKVFDILHQKGFLISLDDFGSGYSSLNVLKDFKVDVLKLDRFMLGETLASEREKTIVANTIKMAKELNMSVVAEGVETLDQVKFLREFGCDTAQGFYYSKPISVEDFDKILSDEEK